MNDRLLSRTYAAPDEKYDFAALSFNYQRKLIDLLIARSRTELERRFPQAKAIVSGLRARADRRHAGQVKFTREPCLVFLVERKVQQSELPLARQLPAWIELPEAIICGIRIRVPTDIQELGVYRRGVPHAAPARVVTLSEPHDPELGQLCCVVRSSEAPPDELFAISCMHVLTPIGARAAGQIGQATVFLADADSTAAAVAESLQVCGQIVAGGPGGVLSFDAQLASVADKAQLRAALGDVTLTDIIQRAQDLPTEYFLQTSRGPIRLMRNAVLDAQAKIDYPQQGGGSIPVHHAELITSIFPDDSPALAGDSGAPLTSKQEGGLLVGMHIAGDVDQRLAYAIPAWRLLDVKNYDPGRTEQWEVVPLDQLPAAPDHPAVVATASPLAGLAPPVVNKADTNSRRAFAVFAKRAGDALVAQGFEINATVCACQAILESDWGTSGLTRNHHAFFGIKAPGNFTGGRARFPTREFEGGRELTVSDDFRAYPDWWHSFVDYGQLIGRARRYDLARQNRANALACLQAIKAAGYATDPNYVTKVQRIAAAFPAELGTI